ncbi:MAG: hypothetical protein ACOC33_02545 [bacterium]
MKDWKELKFRLNRFGTGDYVNNCSECKSLFIGDKRASLCFECDLKEVNEILNNKQSNIDLNEKVQKIFERVHKESQDNSIPIDEKIGVKILKSAGILTDDNKLSDKYDFFD